MVVQCRGRSPWKQRWEDQLATRLTDFRVFTFQSFSVLLQPCVYVVQFQVALSLWFLSWYCSGERGDATLHVCDVTRVQFTITVVSHLRWLLRRAAVAVLGAMHYRSSALQSTKTKGELHTVHLWKVQQRKKVSVCFPHLTSFPRWVTNAAFKRVHHKEFYDGNENWYLAKWMLLTVMETGNHRLYD